MAAHAVEDLGVLSVARVRVTLLGPFAIKLDERSAGPWYRPVAKRLCELVMLSHSQRLGREVARDLLFPKLPPAASANALSTALSLAREALAPLGHVGTSFLRADRANIWVAEEISLDIDAEAHDRDLRSALGLEPGAERDAALSSALKLDGVLLDEDRYADWAVAPREALELLRQRARLALARDRARGFGRSHPDAVVEAWEDCLSADPTSEEAASSLVRIYSVRGNQQLAASAYQRCRAALEVGGLTVSPELARLPQTRITVPPILAGTWQPGTVASGSGKEERRTVSVLHAELLVPADLQVSRDPEDLRSLVGNAVASLIAEAEGLGGTVTSVSGSGVVAIFGAPEAHEDDPERAVTSASRMVAATATGAGGIRMHPLSLRAGVETGPAVVGRLWSATGVGYGAVGSVVQLAAALASAAKPGSVLVGPATRAATEGVFEWGPPGAEGGPRRPWTGPTSNDQNRVALTAAATQRGRPWSGAPPNWPRLTRRCTRPHRGMAPFFS